MVLDYPNVIGSGSLHLCHLDDILRGWLDQQYLVQAEAPVSS